MKPSIWDILTGILVLAIVCLACTFTQIFFNPAAAFNPFPPPTAFPTLDILIQSATPVAAVRTLPATWTTTPIPESTIIPEGTLKPSSTLPATATQFIMPTGTATMTATPTASATRPDSRCQVVDENPRDNTVFAPGQEFDKRWTLRNTSGDTWRFDIIDIRFQSGTPMQTGPDAYDLTRDVANRDSFDFSIRMRAPSSAGTYTGNWALVTGDKNMCSFFVKIVVK